LYINRHADQRDPVYIDEKLIYLWDSSILFILADFE
jgi:hypothetical protein